MKLDIRFQKIEEAVLAMGIKQPKKQGDNMKKKEQASPQKAQDNLDDLVKNLDFDSDDIPADVAEHAASLYGIAEVSAEELQALQEGEDDE